MAGRPQVPEGIGEKSQFKDLSLELKSHKTAEFDVDTNRFKIEIKAPKQIRSIYKLFHYDAQGTESVVENGVLIQMKDDIVAYYVAVKEVGWYKLNIFATRADDKEKSLPCVFTFLFNVKRFRENVYPYPVQFADWKYGCYLHDPLFIDPNDSNEKVKFEVEVPGAKKVAVKAGDEWTHLKQKSGNTWKGEVCLSHHVKSKGEVKINLNACMGSDETSYVTLLTYTK